MQKANVSRDKTMMDKKERVTPVFVVRGRCIQGKPTVARC
jgi:hypothetical protein